MKNVLNSVAKIEKELEAIKKAVLEGSKVEATEEVGFDLDKLDSMKLAELKKVADDAGIEYGKKPTVKSLKEAILEFYADEEEAEDEEEEEEEDEDSEDEDEESEGYSEEDLEEMDDEELTEVAEELELDVAEFQKKKGKKKVLDRSELIEAILEAQEESDEDSDDDEDESEEGALEFLDDEELDELSTDELKAHHTELVAYVEEELEEELPKGAKLKGKAKDKDIKKAILALYDFIEEAEGEDE